MNIQYTCVLAHDGDHQLQRETFQRIESGETGWIILVEGVLNSTSPTQGGRGELQDAHAGKMTNSNASCSVNQTQCDGLTSDPLTATSNPKLISTHVTCTVEVGIDHTGSQMLPLHQVH